MTTVLITVSPLLLGLQITRREENAKGSGKIEAQIMWSSLYNSVHRHRKRRMQRLLPQMTELTLTQFKGKSGGTGSYCSAQALIYLWCQQILLKHVISLRWYVQWREKLDREKKKRNMQHTWPFVIWPWITVRMTLLMPWGWQVSDLIL